MGYQEHQQKAGQRCVLCAVVTCSDTRIEENDISGKRIQELLVQAGHRVGHYQISKDDPVAIENLLNDLCDRSDIQAIIFNGGTGISCRDHTFDAINRRLSRILPGFGELFRMLSYQSIASGAMLSRAIAGIVAASADTPHERTVVVFSIPGSPNAVELAMTRLILPELSHLVWELKR